MIGSKYSEYGVACNPSVVENGGRAKVVYDGILAKNGADRVFACVGYGANNKWSDVQLMEMKRVEGEKFDTEFMVSGKDSLNLAFKDSAEHWDNNCGHNYVFPIK